MPVLRKAPTVGCHFLNSSKDWLSTNRVKKYPIMAPQIDLRYIKSSNLIFGIFGLGLINLYYERHLLTDVKNIAIAVLALLFILATGFIVRIGQNWVKYLLLVLTVVGLIGVPVVLNNIVENPMSGIINVAQTILQIWALILLFRIPKTSNAAQVGNNS